MMIGPPPPSPPATADEGSHSSGGKRGDDQFTDRLRNHSASFRMNQRQANQILPRNAHDERAGTPFGDQTNHAKRITLSTRPLQAQEPLLSKENSE